MKKHHYRIVKPFRFFTFVFIVVMLVMWTASTVIGSGRTEAASVSTYLQVHVEENDSLWTIAENYCRSDKDLRRFIDEICEINDINVNEYLQEGQIIFVPLE